MHPVHDVDALLLLAIALASKRRPAEPVDIVAAIDVLRGEVPDATELSEAFFRLAAHGLIVEMEGCFALTPDAQKLIAALPRKAASAEQMAAVRSRLSACMPQAENACVAVTPEQLRAAILAHRAGEESAARSLLRRKPQPEGDKKRPGQRQRKPLPAGKHRHQGRA